MLTAVYNADLFDPPTMERLMAQYRGLLDQAVARPDAPIGSLSLLAPEQRALLPDPTAPLDRAWQGPIHGALRRIAAAAPDRQAVADRGGVWTYAALDAWAGSLARRLLEAGVGRGDRVAIYGQRCAALAATVFGVLEAGAAFVILDPTYPPRRLAETVEAAGAAALVHLEEAGALPDALAERLDRLAEASGLARLSVGARPEPGADGVAGRSGAVDVEVGPDDAACVAFTSGSTGRPKGIVGRHGSLTHFLPWQAERFGLGAGDRFSLLSGLAHDPLQRDLFTPAWLGATLVVPDPRDMGTPERLRRWLASERVTVAHLTPAMGKVLTDRLDRDRPDRDRPEQERPERDRPERLGGDDPVPSLRRAFLVGDVLTRRDVARLRRLCPRLGVVNLYGSTETQRAVAFHEVPGAAPGRSEGPAREVLPLGRGMTDVQLLVLDPSDGLAGIGEVGEIAVRSPHLALGYLDDDALTAARFTANPLAAAGREDARDRVYRTGDLGRYDAAGRVHFLGRADRQVKIRGFRIETGEIVSHLENAPGVRDAAVLPRADGPLGERLAAYVVPAEERPAVDDLRAHLRERLPAYMVPATWVFLDALPLTPNRKLDRRALLALDDRGERRATPTRGPVSAAERTLAAIVEEVLGLDRIDVEDNFFDLGGNSLLLVRVHGRVEEAFGREIAMVELFNHPSVAALAGFLGAPAAEEEGGAGRDDGGSASRDGVERRGDRLRQGRDRLRRRRRGRDG